MHLKDYCKKNNITLQSVAKAVGMGYTHFNNCLNNFNGRKFSLTMAREIERFTDSEVTIDDLIPKIKPDICDKCGHVVYKKKKKAA